MGKHSAWYADPHYNYTSIDNIIKYTELAILARKAMIILIRARMALANILLCCISTGWENVLGIRRFTLQCTVLTLCMILNTSG